jgi:hypothetical protein
LYPYRKNRKSVDTVRGTYLKDPDRRVGFGREAGMPANRVRSLVRTALAPLALPPDDRPDGELLACFLSSRDESAFAALVRRHNEITSFTRSPGRI